MAMPQYAAAPRHSPYHIHAARCVFQRRRECNLRHDNASSGRRLTRVLGSAPLAAQRTDRVLLSLQHEESLGDRPVCWGDGYYGQLGRGTFGWVTVPTPSARLASSPRNSRTSSSISVGVPR